MNQVNEGTNRATPTTNEAPKRSRDVDSTPRQRDDRETIEYLRFELHSLASWNHEMYHDGDLTDCTAPHCGPAAAALRDTRRGVENGIR